MILGFFLGLIACALFAFIWCCIDFQCIKVSGNSMSPTLRDFDVLLGDRKFTLKRGDIVSCFDGRDIATKFEKYSPFSKRKSLIKRVIALPKDMIEIKKGKVFVNGFQIYEDYVFRFSKDDYPLTRVPEGMVFVLGDNRCYSKDSRNPYVGFIMEENIISKVFMRVLPTKNYGML